MADGLAPAYEAMSIQYERSMTEISYFTSVQILCMGVLPLLFVPLMNIYGRKPFLMFSSLACCVLNIGGGFCETYAQQMATRILVSCFLSTGAAVGSCIVADTSFSHERGKKMDGGPLVIFLVPQEDLFLWDSCKNMQEIIGSITHSL